jgi:DUF971 family protein
MSESDQEASRRPIQIKLHTQSRELELVYPNQSSFLLSFELLRVYSPSAEVKGHGKGSEVLQVGKKEVKIVSIEPAGNYAIKITFDDGHDSGLYDWKYLYQLGEHKTQMWQDYLERLKNAGQSREPSGK